MSFGKSKRLDLEFWCLKRFNGANRACTDRSLDISYGYMEKQHNGTPKTNYQSFLRINTSRFRGEWIAVVGSNVVAHGKRADRVYREAAKKYTKQRISLAKIPKEETLVLCFVFNTNGK